MARLARRSPSSDESDQKPSNITPSPSHEEPTSSISPAQFMSSDKENRVSASSKAQPHGQKRKSDASAPRASADSNKRRRVTTSPRRASISGRETGSDNDVNDTTCYDPDQNQDQRRAVRRGLRDLFQQLNDSRAEYLQSESTGLVDTLKEAGKLFRNVKNTSDATIDSRLLVTAGDLSLKKTQQLVLGNASVGVDLDDFVSKCVSYMRRGPNNHDQSASHPEDDEYDEEEDDLLDWDYLGRTVCFPNSYRPALSSFLLGPLSVQKKVRQVSQRKGRQERIDRANATRPQELEQEDLDKQKTANLTQICKQIQKQLVKISVDGGAACEREIDDDMTDEEAQKIMAKHHLSDDGGIPFLEFCINPHSFGQTVENIFYISFLIKEGTVGLYRDSRGFPTLHTGEAMDPKEVQRQGLSRNQAVLSIDFDTWEELKKAFDIKKSIIPHREEEEFDDGTGAWYA